jgi:Protein of unknown function VcgC/VcgE (DUF2780)
MTSVAGAFKQLGLKPEMVTKAVPVLTSYVSKMGGADVGSLLGVPLRGRQQPFRGGPAAVLEVRSHARRPRRLPRREPSLAF